MPAGYVIVAATGGPNSDNNPVGFREHKSPAYRGLRVIPGVGPYPIQEHFYARGSAPEFVIAVQRGNSDHRECELHPARYHRPQVSAMGFDRKTDYGYSAAHTGDTEYGRRSPREHRDRRLARLTTGCQTRDCSRTRRPAPPNPLAGRLA